MERIHYGRNRHMSYIGEQLADWEFASRQGQPHRSVDFETNWLRQMIDLNLHVGSGHEEVDDVNLGALIDDSLVEFIGFLVSALKKEDVPLDAVKETMARIESGMWDDSALQAYAGFLAEGKGMRLSSAIYLDLAQRHATYGGKPPPKLEEGRQFVSAFLDRFMTKEYRNRDFHSESLLRKLADARQGHLNPDDASTLIRHSESSPAARKLLQLIGKDSVEAESTHLLPNDLLIWSLEDQHRDPKHPKGAPSARGRRRTYGLRHRDNEIRNGVALLDLVGFTVSDARKAIGDVFGLTDRRLRDICEEPYWTLKDLHEDVYRRLDPVSYHESRKRGSGPEISTPT